MLFCLAEFGFAVWTSNRADFVFLVAHFLLRIASIGETHRTTGNACENSSNQNRLENLHFSDSKKKGRPSAGRFGVDNPIPQGFVPGGLHFLTISAPH